MLESTMQCGFSVLWDFKLDSKTKQKWRQYGHSVMFLLPLTSFLDEHGIVGIAVCFNLLHLKYFKICFKKTHTDLLFLTV